MVFLDLSFFLSKSASLRAIGLQLFRSARASFWCGKSLLSSALHGCSRARQHGRCQVVVRPRCRNSASGIRLCPIVSCDVADADRNYARDLTGRIAIAPIAFFYFPISNLPRWASLGLLGPHATMAMEGRSTLRGLRHAVCWLLFEANVDHGRANSFTGRQ